jgi:hypothetical protein
VFEKVLQNPGRNVLAKNAAKKTPVSDNGVVIAAAAGGT